MLQSTRQASKFGWQLAGRNFSYLWFSDPILARLRDVLVEGFLGEASFFFAGDLGFLGANSGSASNFSSFS
jgi:hypothetical protein